jgi:hypothetical protein
LYVHTNTSLQIHMCSGDLSETVPYSGLNYGPLAAATLLLLPVCAEALFEFLLVKLRNCARAIACTHLKCSQLLMAASNEQHMSTETSRRVCMRRDLAPVLVPTAAVPGALPFSDRAWLLKASEQLREQPLHLLPIHQTLVSGKPAFARNL